MKASFLNTILFISVTAACLLCGFSCKPRSRTTNPGDHADSSHSITLTEESRVKVVVYQYLIAFLSDPNSKQIWFISLSPSEKALLLERMKGSDIKDASAAKYIPGSTFVDRITGQPGVALEIKSITMDSRNAQVRAGYYSSAGVTQDFQLVKNDKGEWEIKKVHNQMVTD